MQTAERTSPTLRLILKKHPDYDTARHRFVSGDVVTNVTTQALCYILEGAIEYCSCLVLRAGFGMPKGVEIRVPYTDLEYFDRGAYQRPPYKVSKKLYWEAGDIVQRDGDLFLVRKRPETDPRYVYAIALESGNPYVHIGECFSVPDPYWGYHGGVRGSGGLP